MYKSLAVLFALSLRFLDGGTPESSKGSFKQLMKQLMKHLIKKQINIQHELIKKRFANFDNKPIFNAWTRNPIILKSPTKENAPGDHRT